MSTILISNGSTRVVSPTVTTGMKYSFNLNNCRRLDTSALIQVFNNLETIETSKEIRVYRNIGSPDLSESDIEIATNKGWTVFASE